MEKQWFKKDCPKQLQDLDHSHRVTELLMQLAKKPNFPHLLIYGPPGSGKYLRAKCFLHQIFGYDVYSVKYQEQQIFEENQEGKYSKGKFYMVGNSKYHLEIDIANYNGKDSKILSDLIENCSFNKADENKMTPRVLLIKSSCKLSKVAQAALRATMQKQTGRMRIIFICQNIHCIIAPIRSRCLNIKIKAPTDNQLYSLLLKSALAFNSKLSLPTIQKLVQISEGNIKKALNYLQSCDNLLKGNKNVNLLFNILDHELLQIINMIFQYKNCAQSKLIKYKLKGGTLIRNSIRQIPLLLLKKFSKRGIDDKLLKMLIQQCGKYQIIFLDLKSHDEKLTAFMLLVEGCMNAIKQHEEQNKKSINTEEEEQIRKSFG